MALVITPGSPDADSMATVDEANIYISGNFPEEDVEIWDALELSKKEQLLRLGAEVMGYLPFRGYKMYIGQTMVFPRNLFPSIPQIVKNAQIELTMNVALRAELVQPSIATGAESSSKISQVSLAGIISVSFDEEGDASGSLLDQLVRNINLSTFAGLRKYLTSIRGGTIGNAQRYVPVPFEVV